MMTGTAIRIAANRVKCPFFNVGGELVPLLDRFKKIASSLSILRSFRFESSRVRAGMETFRKCAQTFYHPSLVATSAIFSPR